MAAVKERTPLWRAGSLGTGDGNGAGGAGKNQDRNEQ